MEKQNEFNQNAVKKADFGVTIPTKDAEEYYEYKRCKKRAEIIGAIAKSTGEFFLVGEGKQQCEKAARYRQASVRMPLTALALECGYFRLRGVKMDCAVGGDGETLAKVKAYEAKCALKLHADEITLRLSPTAVADCRYGAIRKEIKKLRRIAGKKILKVRVDKRYSPERLSRVARICSEVGADYFSVPYFSGCESLKTALTGGCKLEISGVETLEIYKRMFYAGVERIATNNAQAFYEEWIKEVDRIGLSMRKETERIKPPLAATETRSGVPALPLPSVSAAITKLGEKTESRGGVCKTENKDKNIS